MGKRFERAQRDKKVLDKEINGQTSESPATPKKMKPECHLISDEKLNTFAEELYENIKKMMNEPKFKYYPKEVIARLIVLSLAKYDSSTDKTLGESFGIICNDIALPRACCSHLQYAALPPAAKNTPSDADLLAAYKYLGQLGPAIENWDNYTKRTIRYIGRLHASYVQQAELAAILTPIIQAAVNNAVQNFVDNTRAMNRNFTAVNALDSAAVLSPIKKTIDGIGPGISTVHTVPVAVNVGNASSLFPLTVGHLDLLTKEDINDLAIQYNDNFGILVTDNRETMKKKFTQWICGEKFM